MHASHIRDIQRDANYTKEGCEHAAAYWELIVKHLAMTKLENELERGLLAQEMNEFRRRCVDNDKPGKRHILPFVWVKARSFGDVVTEHQVPIKLDDLRFNAQWAKYRARMDALKRRG